MAERAKGTARATTPCEHQPPSRWLSSTPPPIIQAPVGAHLSTSSSPPLREDWLCGVVEAVTADQKWIVKALNIQRVPGPLLGRVDIAIHSDGRFGAADPLLWPQVVAPEKLHLVFIPRRPATTHAAALLWDAPTDQNFRLVNDDPEGGEYGLLDGSTFASMQQVTMELHNKAVEFRRQTEASAAAISHDRGLSQDVVEQARVTRDLHVLQRRLDDVKTLMAKLVVALDMFKVPSSWRECAAQWGHLHRCYAELWAWLEWDKCCPAGTERSPTEPLPVHPGLDGHGVMGGFVVDKRLATKLYTAGAPTWFLLRRVTAAGCASRGSQEFEQPTGIPATKITHIHSNETVGPCHIAAIWAQSHAVLDVEYVPLPDKHELRLGKGFAETGLRSSQQRVHPHHFYREYI